VFHPFNKKQKFDDVAKLTLTKQLSTLLEIQLATHNKLAPNHPMEDENGYVNRKALGYIFGFIDAALASFGQDTSNPALSIPVIWQVLRRLFPGNENRYTEFIVAHIGQNEVLMLGAMHGGQQYVDFRHGRIDAPMGLARFLTEGDKQEAPDFP
jgi:hypothetical protein